MQAMQAAHHDKTEENEIIVPESPEEYQQQIAKPLSDECPQLPLTPGAAAKHQQLQFSSPQHHHRTTSYLQQQSKTGKKFNLNAAAQQARGSSGTAAVKLSAESTATGDQDRGAAPDTEDSQTSSDSDESEEDDGCASDDASDADWSPQQPSSKPCKGPRSRAQHRTPIKTPNKHPFPQIQHDPEQIKRLTSPTKNRNIAECFAAIASLQRDKAHTPKKTPTQAQQAAAATGGDGAAVPGGSVMTGTKGHNDNNQPAKVLTAAAAAAVGNEVTVDLISDGSGNNSDSDVEITGEVLSQQQQDQQQQTQQQRHTSLKHTSGDMATQTRRNLSVTRIREQAAAAKAAKLAGMLTGDSQQQNLKPTQYQAAAINASAATPASAAAASHKEGKVASSIQTAQDPIPLSDPVTKDTMLRQYESMAAAVTSHAATAAGRHISTVQTPAPVPGAVKDELTFMHSSQPFTPDKNTAGRTPISQQQQQQLAQHIAQELLFDSFDTRQAERASDNEKPATHLKRAACLQSDAAASDDSSRKRQRTLNQHTADPQVPTQHTAAVATRDKLAIPCDRSLLQTVELQVQTGFARQGMQNSTAATAAPPVVVIDTPGVQQTITTYVIRALGGSSQQDMVHCEPENGLLCGPIAVDDTATTKQAEHQAQLPYKLVCVPASQGMRQQPAVVGNCAGTAAAAAAAGSGRDPQMMQCQKLKRYGEKSAPEAAAAPTAAPNADSTSASSSGVTGHESVVTTEVAGDDDLQVHAAAVADTAAAGRDLQSTSSLVLDHIQLLPSDHLTSWPSVKNGQKRVLPRFTFTAAARAHLMGLVNSRPERTPASHTKLRSPARAPNRRKKGKQRRGRGRATGAAAAAVGSPQAAASDGGDDEADGLPFPDLLDAEKGVYMDWKTVPRGEVVYMEYMADGQVFHQFKQQYTDIFYNATERQQLSSNILVGVADPCHPCNHNPLEPLLSHQQCLEQLQQHYKQAQQQQLPGLPLEQPDKQPSRAACQQVLLSGVADQQQHAVGRLLLAARDLDVCELLGMYIPGKSGYMLTSEDDERTKVDLTSEAIMFPYQMTFDFHKPAECDLPGGQDDFVMCEADPSSCIMALINDSTEWAQQMEKLGMSCPRKAQVVPGSCTCHKYKGRSNNTFIVQCVYKAHDDTPVPVALFFTSRPVLEREELLWSYDGEGGEAGAYFGNQKVDRAQRTYVQLEGALRQMTVQWLQEDLQQLCQFLPQQAATQAAPAAAASQSTAVLESAKQHIGRLQARFLVTEYVRAKLAYLRSSCLVDRLLGPAPECDREVAAAVAAAFPAGTTAASSSDNTGKRSRVRQGLQGRQQALIKHMVERRAHTLDPVAAVNVALSDGQLAGQELPPRWRAMLERLQQQLQQQGLQQQAVQQDLQQLQVVMQQCLLQLQESTSNTAAAGALQVDAAKVLCTNDEQQDRIQQQCPQQGVQQEGHQEGLKQHANVQGTTSVAHGVASVDSAAASAPSIREADEPGSAMPGGELTAVRKQLAAVTEQCRFLEQLLQAKTMECDGLKEELQASRHM